MRHLEAVRSYTYGSLSCRVASGLALRLVQANESMVQSPPFHLALAAVTSSTEDCSCLLKLARVRRPGKRNEVTWARAEGSHRRIMVAMRDNMAATEEKELPDGTEPDGVKPSLST